MQKVSETKRSKVKINDWFHEKINGELLNLWETFWYTKSLINVKNDFTCTENIILLEYLSFEQIYIPNKTW